MAVLKAGIIGCGRPNTDKDATGSGMAHLHAEGYESHPGVQLVAVTDIRRKNMEAFCSEHDVPRGYTGAEEMFAKEDLDIVSICLWPHLHAPMVMLAAEAGVKAIHCEKPMAPTFSEAKEMVEVCDSRNVLLTFDHQRRFGEPYAKAKELLLSGEVGRLERIEAFASNLYDWGTHWFDMLLFYTEQRRVKWVLGQIDAKSGAEYFGVRVEGQGMSLFEWEDGVLGLLVTACEHPYSYQTPPAGIACFNRIIGSDGTIEVGVLDGPALRIRNGNTRGVWKDIKTDGALHAAGLVSLAIADLVDSILKGTEPLLSGRNALQATELIFATYESSRLRSRITLPLQVTDSPFLSMLDNAEISPWLDKNVRLNGININYHRTGRPGPQLVLAHGFSDNGMCWLRTAQRLEKEYDVFMYDARGHGLSDAPEESCSNDQMARDLVEFLKKLNLNHPVVLGHSMGASTASTAAGLAPGLFGGIILEDPPWFEEDFTLERREKRRADIEKARNGLMENRSRSKTYLMEKCKTENPRWHPSILGHWALAKQQVSVNVLNYFEGAPPSWKDQVAAYACPVLLLTAGEGLVTQAIQDEICAVSSKVTAIRFENAGHSIRRDVFEEYLKAVLEFLHRITGDAGEGK